MSPRYAIGIDLGTTNCVLAYLDGTAPRRGPQVLPVPQWESPVGVSESATFPSFAYLPPETERQAGFVDPRLPVLPDGWVPGLHARARLAETPGRVVHSAKSWLSHAAVDRTAAILPWQSPDIPPESRLSPLAASALYLRWLREVWTARMSAADPQADFAAQEVVVTVPASFDEAAQELTLEAARLAGYPESVRLLEEPQAAFYDWLGAGEHRRRLLDLLEGRPEGIRVLVCDVGGGTSDFSLFEAAADAGSPEGLLLRRIAVSDHLLLGGDNIDLTLAYRLEERLTGGRERLSGRQLGQLLAQARGLKERFLGEGGTEEEQTVTLAAAGAGLVAGARSARLAAAEVREVILDGFFPPCGVADGPRQRGGGLREWGLPYAADTAVTRHLAAFLEGRRVDAVLFNGGTLTPPFLRERLHRLLGEWQGGKPPAVLGSRDPALAVARGASRYGYLLSRPAAGGRIAGGHAHALYLEVGRGRKDASLVCVLPRGLEAGRTLRLENAEFDLRVNQPVRFQAFYSNRRQDDPPGGVVGWNERDFRPLPPVETAIHLPPERPRPANNRLRVTLEASLSELGLLRLWCVEEDGPGRWRLDFNLRRGLGGEEEQAAPVPEAPLVPEQQLREADRLLRALYGKKKEPELPEVKPRQLLRRLEQTLGSGREQWDGATQRALWPTLAAGLGRRGRSPEHEESWLYLAGWLLRPGYGFPLDEARMEELWHLFPQGMTHPRERRVQVQWWLLWRRTAGGLHAGRQEKVLERILPALRGGELLPEMLYLAGSLERISLPRRRELVRICTEGLFRPRIKAREPYAWALGRLIARAPLYAGPEAVLPPAEVETLYRRLAELDWRDPAWSPLVPLFAQAARRTEVRDLDLEEGLRREIAGRLREAGALPEQVRAVREYVPVADEDRARQFGEALPAGLILVRRE